MAEGQVGLCCRVAELSDKCGNELLNLIEADAYRLGKQVQQFIFTQQVQALDAELSTQRVHEEGAECEVVFDGKDPLTFVTRFGVIRVPIQQAHCKSHRVDFTMRPASSINSRTRLRPSGVLTASRGVNPPSAGIESSIHWRNILSSI